MIMNFLLVVMNVVTFKLCGPPLLLKQVLARQP